MKRGLKLFFRRVLAMHGIVQSMSRKGNCWDNEVAESFIATLEWELIEDADWHSRHVAARDIFHFIDEASIVVASSALIP